MTTLYQAVKAAGCEIDSYRSDLYVRDSAKALELVKASGLHYEHFTSSDGSRWIDIFGAYDPFWEARAPK